MSDTASSKDWGFGCLGIIAVAVLFVVFSRNSGSPNPAPAPGPLGTFQTKAAAPCAVDRSASDNMIRAIQDRDQEAIDGLAERKQLFILAEGTRFEVSANEPGGMVWGFVRSGRYSGETCYIIAAVVR